LTERAIALVLKAATERLTAAGHVTARLDAEILLSHVLNLPRLRLYTEQGRALEADEAEAFEALLIRREKGEPVAYLTGAQEFWSLEFKVSPETLIPRPDTETLVEVVTKAVRDPHHILDLGTGTGCILLSLLSEYPQAQGMGVDLTPGAVMLAGENAEALGFGGRAAFRASDWFSDVQAPEGGVDVIVSNPPYSPSADIRGLMTDVRDYEPMSALDGGDDGLAPYRLIAAEAGDYLAGGGLLAVEVGIGQAEDVASLFAAAGFADIAITSDLGGINRVVSGKKTP